jgi:hypothetical protein
VAGALENAMFVRAGESLGLRGGAGVYAIRVAVDGDGRNGDARLGREPHFNLIIPRIAGAGREPVTMPIGMDDDSDEVWIIGTTADFAPGGLAAGGRGVVTRPGLRSLTGLCANI